jgi:hypothetical protein
MGKTIQNSSKDRDRNLNLDNSMFDITDFSFRQFQTFLIILKYEGEELSTLKNLIDLKFEYKSRTKGYDQINAICNKGMAYKKVIMENGKKVTRIFIKNQVRKEYEEFVLPTIDNIKESLQNLYKNNSDDLKNLENINEKFKNYSQILIAAVQKLISSSEIKEIKSKQFPKKISDTVWKYFKAEMLKYEIFSK